MKRSLLNLAALTALATAFDRPREQAQRQAIIRPLSPFGEQLALRTLSVGRMQAHKLPNMARHTAHKALPRPRVVVKKWRVRP